MKNLYIVCFVSIISTITLQAQNKATLKADKLFRQFEYVQAATEYLKLTEKDNYVCKQLAESYYNMFDSKEAIKWYAKTILQPQDAETYFKYAQILKANGQYKEANDQMATFSSKAPEDDRAKEFKENPNYLLQLSKKRNNFNIAKLAINSDKSEFGAFLSSDNNLYFASARNKSNKIDGIKEEPYLDIFKAAYNQDGTFSIPTEIVELNTKWHDGPVSITADGNTMYFARESFSIKNFEKDKKNNLKYGQVNLFKATQSDGVWTNIVGLPFNSKNYSTSCPSISSDGKTLYFSSNMPGGRGDNDIWKVSVNADETMGNQKI